MKARKKVKLLPIDKFFITLIVVLLITSPILIVYSKSLLSKSSIEVERIKNKIEKQKTINESISMKINELASLTNVQNVANEYGLSYQNENILIIK